MEEMRGAAMAYYANMSIDQQQKLLSFYKSLDTNGDGKVSIQEYLDFLVKKGYTQYVPPNLFELLDENNDGTLNFDECVTFFYMINGIRLVICDECGSYLWGLYFLCVKCYSARKRPYDLCCSCYRNKNFVHAHSNFLDNYALLRTNMKLREQLPHRAAEAVVQAIALKALVFVLDTASAYYTAETLVLFLITLTLFLLPLFLSILTNK